MCRVRDQKSLKEIASTDHIGVIALKIPLDLEIFALWKGFCIHTCKTQRKDNGYCTVNVDFMARQQSSLPLTF